MKYYIIFFFLTFLISCREESRITSRVKVRIDYLRCQYGTQGARSLIKVNYKEKIHLVPITKSYCKTLKKGEYISLYYSYSGDKIFYKKQRC